MLMRVFYRILIKVLFLTAMSFCVKVFSNQEAVNLESDLALENTESSNEAFDLSKSLGFLEASWKSSFEMKYFKDDSTNTALTKAKIYGRLNWDLSDSFSFYSKAVFIGRSGTTQSIYDRLDLQEGLNQLETFFTWKWNSFFWLDFGNIQQSFLQAPLLITDKTFSSAKLNFSLDHWFKRFYKASALVQLAIPSNAEKSQRKGQIIKGFPFFGVGSLYLKSLSLPFLSFEHIFFNRFNVWMYYNLPPAVAHASNLYGNDIQGMRSDSVFKYDYYGFHNHTGFKAVLSSIWAGDIGFEYIKNLGSPSESNEGARVYTSLYYNYQNFVEIKGLFEYFKNRSNSAVAFYNSEVYGHNNRRGFLALLQCYFYESGISAGASLVSSRAFSKRAAIGPSLSGSVFLTVNYIKLK